MMLDILLYSGNIWLIIGLLLAILELTNGTLIFFLPTGASGDPQEGVPGFDGFGDVRQSMLETSNVNVTEELVNMIEAQRVYEMNSKVISAVDKMMGFVNQQL